MKRLYYILAISIKDDDAWGKPEIVFVGFQWMLFFLCPVLVLEELSYSEKIDWYNSELIPPFFFLCSAILLVCLNHFFLFRRKQTNKIIDKYTGKYPLIDKHPAGAYFLFHLILPLVLFISTFLVVGVLKK